MTAHFPDPHLDAQFYDGVPIKRFLAWIIDVVVVFGLVLTALLFTFGLISLIFPVAMFGLNLAYRIFCLQKWSATLGMRTVGIELRGSDGNRLDLSQSVFHTLVFVAIFASLIGALANMIVILVTDRNQGLHDLILGTVAINRPATSL